MLKVRIMPALLWSGFGLGTGFEGRVGPVVPAIEVYTKRDVDELMILISTSQEGTTEPDLFSITDFVRSCNVHSRTVVVSPQSGRNQRDTGRCR